VITLQCTKSNVNVHGLGYSLGIMPLFKTKHWQAQLPDGWVGCIDSAQSFATIYSPEGVGMLHLLIFDKTFDETGKGESFQGGLIGTYYAGTIYKGTFRRSWSLSCCGRALSVRYTCAEHNAEIETQQIDDIVQSIEECNEADR
jgi:hypothetical protein